MHNDSHFWNGKGNVTAVLDHLKNVATTYQYDPFGRVLAQSGSLTQPFQFATKRVDAGTGLVYYGYRFYAPEAGRWLTRDPLGEAGGLNLYAFTGNNPVNWVDFWGLSERDVLKILETFRRVVEDLTKNGRRFKIPTLNNVLSSSQMAVEYIAEEWCNVDLGLSPRYLGCGEQWSVLAGELNKNTYDDHWEFELDKTHSGFFYHERGRAVSENPNDPILILDPWKNRTKRLSGKAKRSIFPFELFLPGVYEF